jgi:hypothetical protein
MDPAIFAALLGAGGTLAGAALTVFSEPLLDVLRLGRMSMVDVSGKWDATWYVEEAGKEKLYASDCIEINNHRGVRFKGKGLDLRSGYIIRGRINSHGIVTFSYDSQERSFALVGGGVLLLNAKATELTGVWHGYVQEGKLVGGRVVWRSERMPSRPSHNLYHATAAEAPNAPPVARPRDNPGG